MNATQCVIQPVEIAEARGFANPDEVREFDKGKVELIKIGGAIIGRATLQPGWKWSTCVKPLAQTPSCEAAHLQYHVAGVLIVRMDDGTEVRCNPGDVSFLPPGHDAWVEGVEDAVIVDFQGMIDYAKCQGHP